MSIKISGPALMLMLVLLVAYWVSFTGFVYGAKKILPRLLTHTVITNTGPIYVEKKVFTLAESNEPSFHMPREYFPLVVPANCSVVISNFSDFTLTGYLAKPK